MLHLRHKLAMSAVILIVILLSLPVQADTGGITLGGTRIIYPMGSKQFSLSVSNTSEKSRYLVQSWVSDHENNKTNDLIATPPLYISQPKDENLLRIMLIRQDLPTDRESLYYFTARAIPSFDKKETAGKNILKLAAATRIKLFVRPSTLAMTADDAPRKLVFLRIKNQLQISNNSPYYQTLVQMNIAGHKLDNFMIAPFSQSTIALPSLRGNQLSFRTLNDYGGMRPEHVINLLDGR